MYGTPAPFLLRSCLVVCGLMVTVPFLFPHHYFPFPSFYAEWLAFALGLAALAAIGSAPSRHAVPIPAMCLGLFAFTAVLALQVALGQVAYPLRSAMGALYSIWGALIVMLGAWLGNEVGERTVSHSLQWWLAIAGTLAAASGFFQYYHTPLSAGTVLQPLEPSNLMFGFVGQSNNFANYLGSALLSVAFLHSRKALGAAAAVPMTLLLAAGMALSGSRTSWGYMIIAFAVVPLLERGGSREECKRVLRIALFALVVFVLVQVLNLYTEVLTGPEGRPQSAGDRFARYLDAGSASERPIRIQFFLYAWMMFLSSPLLGIGFGEYAWRAFELSADLPGPVTAGLDRHAHNLFLQLLAETGMAGLLCIAIPLASWFWRMPWRSLTPERCWTIGVLAVIGLHSMVEFPLWHANFLGVFALLFGLASPAFAALDLSRLRRGFLLMVLVAGCLTARGVWSDYRAFERWFLVIEAKGARGKPPDALDFDVLMALQEKGSFFAPYFERLLSEAIVLDGRDLDDKLALNTQVMRLYPVPSVVHRQIVLFALAGRDSEAARTLRAAVTVYPEWTRKWLPKLEGLAREQPGRFAGLLASARAQLDEAKRDPAFAPLPGKR